MLRCILNAATSMVLFSQMAGKQSHGLHITLSMLVYMFIFMQDGQGLLTFMLIGGLDERVLGTYLSINDYLAWVNLEYVHASAAEEAPSAATSPDCSVPTSLRRRSQLHGATSPGALRRPSIRNLAPRFGFSKSSEALV